MRVLIACESSGVVRRAFNARGHDAWSLDVLPCDDTSDGERHLQEDLISYMRFPTRERFAASWDLIWRKWAPGNSRSK